MSFLSKLHFVDVNEFILILCEVEIRRYEGEIAAICSVPSSVSFWLC